MEMDSITNELKHIRSLEKHLYPKGFCFKKKKKTTKMHGRGKFSKIKGTICSVPIELVDI